MSSRRINATLWTCATALLALAAGVIVWTVLNPVEDELIARSGAQNHPTTNRSATSALPSMASMQAILDRPLRRNLTGESTTTEAMATGGNSTDPPLTLVGTIGTSLAMLKTRDGKIELKGVGETVAGMTVMSISTSRVEMRYNGRLISLDKVPRRG